jgi:hypothetical protein
MNFGKPIMEIFWTGAFLFVFHCSLIVTITFSNVFSSNDVNISEWMNQVEEESRGEFDPEYQLTRKEVREST